MFKSRLRHAVNRWLAPHHVQIMHVQLERDPFAQLLLALEHFRIDTTLDIGANAGQYAHELLESGYAGDIHSVEPLPDAHAALTERASGHPRWHVLERMALGPCEDTVSLQVAGNSLSSSILPMLDQHKASAPESAPVGRIEVPQRPLDAAFEGRLRPNARVLLKIDTQGYEHSVLAGAQGVLRRALLVQLEMSIVPLYEGQRLWRELLATMEAQGFQVWSLQPEFCDRKTGQLLQLNGLFARVPEPEQR